MGRLKPLLGLPHRDEDPYTFDVMLTEPAIVRFNQLMLEVAAHEGDRPHQVLTPSDIRMALQLAYEERDPFRAATMLCLALIITHPFADGNHRTSFFSAQMLLLTKRWLFLASDAEILEFYHWRFRHERRRHLKRAWLNNLSGWDLPHQSRAYIRGFMQDVYAREIERFLRSRSVPVQGNRDLHLKMAGEIIRRIERTMWGRARRLGRRGKRPPLPWTRLPEKKWRSQPRVR